MNKLLIICGPTATGKTKIAIDLAKKFNGELIGADSRHVYKGLGILTGQDKPPDYAKIWVTDFVDPRDQFSVSHYQRLAREALSGIQHRGKLPILIGGTGLYIRSVVEQIDTASVPQNLSLRNTLSPYPVGKLQITLQSIDPSKWGSMNESDRANPRRLVRAIEVATWNTKHQKSKDQAPSLDVVWIGLTASAEKLRGNIQERVISRFAQGVVEEVKSFGKTLDDGSLPAATSLGLMIVREVVAGRLRQDEAIAQWTAQEFAYAKRQLTWFRKEPRVHWFDITDKNYQTDVETLVREWYS